MAFREVSVLEIKEVLRLSRDGVAKKRIAAQLGLDIKTVRSYLKLVAGAGVEAEAEGDLDRATAAVVEALSASHGRAGGADWELCAGQREFIAFHLRHGVRLTKVCRLLGRRQVQVPYMTLYRYAVEELGFSRRPATIPVADCGPGEELRLDTGWVGWLKVDLFGRRKQFRAWIFTAVWAAPLCLPGAPGDDGERDRGVRSGVGILRGCLQGSHPRQHQGDREADPLERKLVLGFLEYAQSRGFHVDPTRVRAPRDKGYASQCTSIVGFEANLRIRF